MKFKYPLIIALIFLSALATNNKIIQWKTFRFYNQLENIDDPIRKELQRDEFLSDEAGTQTLVINLWATWCIPCQKEIPLLNQLVDKYENENTLFLSVTDETEKDVEKWVELQKNEPRYFPLYENKRLINYLFQLNPETGIKKGRYPELLPTNIIIKNGKLLLFEQGFSEETIVKMDSILTSIH
ncbi:TlpA family protein disulfide reductase [Maribellus maritimus]|uniref:TlpA family protein disulfide reductase n=1 Tax=Maribellus maritimus TaxID=2870838 RepID=UPI001EEAA645|nr:TlpA disulfide reductase family protein [Maribellus maritimus]MCG6190160.1 TlpA family protein disulfide reductase [Maribellus maritimus]